jgi:hypothetical protein
MPPLPDWCEVPIDIKQAALVLGVARSTLDDALKDSRFKAGEHYELRGNRKIFYRDNILKMRKALTQCAYKSNGGMAGLTPVELDPVVDESAALLRLRTLAAQKS